MLNDAVSSISTISSSPFALVYDAFFFFQAEDGIRDKLVTGVQTCALPILAADPDAPVGARELVSALAEEEAERLGVAYRRIRIGGQRTLWGSCSPAGTLSFNWRLVLAPVEVLDYVVVHEVCHLRYLDHSRHFWGLVEGRRPHWREQRDWLREHGPELLAFKASE